MTNNYWATGADDDQSAVLLHRPSFACVWFPSIQRWRVIFEDGSTLPSSEHSMGLAVNAALAKIGAGQAEYECTMSNSEFFRYEKDNTCQVEK